MLIDINREGSFPGDFGITEPPFFIHHFNPRQFFQFGLAQFRLFESWSLSDYIEIIH